MRNLVLAVWVACAGSALAAGFDVGCNYWASHAGMFMWRQWDRAVVEQDFAALAANGVTRARVFPLWPDFQPISTLRGGSGRDLGMVGPDGATLADPDGVDPAMLERFRAMCDIAARHDVKLVVGLLTGWMSGRLFVPPAFDGVNVLSDPRALRWEVRFVRRFVRELKDHPAILSWDLGNECNCMAGVADADAAWNWMNAISAAIRLEDPSRPVVSGMHSLSTKRDERWNLRDQGELMDELTTHPYPLFTPLCSKEPFDTLRNELHGVAESLLYAGVSGKPCFVEEAGNLSPNIASDARTAAHLRTALASAWTHGIDKYLWWCAFDFGHLGFPPYNATALERELGLMTRDRKPKPAIKEMAAFRCFLDALPFRDLPPRRIDAVCLVSETADFWPQAFAAFLLSKQAGFDLDFQSAERTGRARGRAALPAAKLYILPSGGWYNTYSKQAWDAVKDAVRNGATLLYAKGRNDFVSEFREVTGCEIESHYATPVARVFALDAFPDRPIALQDDVTQVISAKEARVIGRTAAGEPVATVADYGKGKVVLVNGALELDVVRRGDCFHAAALNPAYLVYRAAAGIAGIARKVVKTDAPGVGITEHPQADGSTLVVAINYEPTSVRCAVRMEGRLEKICRGTVQPDRLDLPANDFAVFQVR